MSVTINIVEKRFCKNERITDIYKSINISRTNFYIYRNRHQKDDFDALCIQNYIVHVIGAIGTLTTLDKIERWRHTYNVERPRFRKYEQLIKYYNNKRVQMSLNYITSGQVYTGR